jgi:hypothetical protein
VSELLPGKVGPIGQTDRGFELIKFLDHNGRSCSLQQSSLAHYEPPGSSAVWLGVEDQRMHLTVGQVRELLPILRAWVEGGSFNSGLQARPDQKRLIDERDQPPLDTMLARRVGKKRAGRVLDGRTWDQMPAADTQACRLEPEA